MATIIGVNVDGVQTLAQVEYSSPVVSQQYLQALQAFVNVLNTKAITNSSGQVVTTAASAINAGNLQSVLAAISALQKLAKNGMQIPDPVAVYNLQQTGQYPSGIPSSVLAGLPKVTAYMEVGMATNLDALLRSVQSLAGFTSFSSLTLSQLQEWRNLAVLSSALPNIVGNAQTTALTAPRTLQSMVEVDYVATGNQLLGNAMSSLNQALTQTQNALNTLASLQNLHNDIQVVNKPTFAVKGTPVSAAQFNYSGIGTAGAVTSATQYKSVYLGAASAFFGPPITPVLLSGLTSAGAAQVVAVKNQLVTYRNQLRGEISALELITPASAASNPNSLLGSLKTVLHDISGIFVDTSGHAVTSTTSPAAAYKGLRAWLIDSYSSFASVAGTAAGQIQQNLTNAITAGENLNDTQKEQVQNYLFIFQEYYQSASAVLTQLSQTIQSMAQNIAH